MSSLRMAKKLDSVLGAMAGITLGPSKIVVGLDLGTTYTGTMYCQRRDPDNIYAKFDWEGQNEILGRPYCKTSTSSLYKKTSSGGSRLFKYGHPAVLEFMSFLGAQAQREDEESRVLLQRVKLHLAGADYVNNDGTLHLPWGLTVHQVLSDFVAEMKKEALKQIQGQLGKNIRESHIQWCLTVPAIWDAVAKEEMKRVAETAGLVGPGGSQHPLLIVLEPEAAALYCDRYMKTSASITGGLRVGDTFLVADIGGGTTDLIVLQKSDHKFREVVAGSGDLCGGTHVDAAFQDFLRTRIGPCFERYKAEDPFQALLFASWWEQKKRSFAGANHNARLDLPVRLAEMWKEQDKAQNSGITSTGALRDRINISVDEVKAIFDPTVNRILELIREQLRESPECKYLFIVGGFGESPYLLTRIRDAFSRRVKIVTPPNAGAAICQGAVLYGLDPTIISERTSRRTYGIVTTRRFKIGDPEEKKFYNEQKGYFSVNDVFSIFVRAGDQVAEDAKVTNNYSPLTEDQRSMTITLLSTAEHNPKWSTDVGVEKSVCFTFDIDRSIPYERRSVDVHMRFGRTSVEVTASGACVIGGEDLKAENGFDCRFGAALCNQ